MDKYVVMDKEKTTSILEKGEGRVRVSRQWMCDHGINLKPKPEAIARIKARRNASFDFVARNGRYPLGMGPK